MEVSDNRGSVCLEREVALPGALGGGVRVLGAVACIVVRIGHCHYRLDDHGGLGLSLQVVVTIHVSCKGGRIIRL